LFDETVKYIDSVPENEWKNEQNNRKKPEVFYYEEAVDAADFVKSELEKPLPPEYSDGYLFITMGAGDNWKLGKIL
jgi:UDP-N-acetylmuramate--alanine ligase